MRDGIFNEDARRIRSGNGATNVAVLRSSARNLLRHEASAGSIAPKRFRAALNDAYLLRVLRA